MIDTHFKDPNFGVMPTIFGVSSYTIFVSLGIIAGLIYYLSDTRKRNAKNEGAIEIVSSALIFGVIGSKIPLIFEGADIQSIIFGKSILGGLIGGMLGVMLIKRILKIKTKMGNIIAPAVALGIAIGRLGCFFNGCCFGIPSPWGWGVDFGDGILRYPTQLFESAFHLTAFIILHNLKTKDLKPGILFRYYVLAYFIFRFLIEFIRENPIFYFGLTLYQLICILGIVFIGLNIILPINKEGVSNGR